MTNCSIYKKHIGIIRKFTKINSLKPKSLKHDILLITPPFTQLNTPYPATAYLKGFLNTKDIRSYQVDLGIEVILNLFSKKGLTKLFNLLDHSNPNISSNNKRIIKLKNDYIHTIDPVIQFLQGKNPSLAHRICEDDFLPEASRFEIFNSFNPNESFGDMGIHDKAKYIATLYLEDISDLISQEVDPHFGFSRYAERLGRSASSFDAIEDELNKTNSFIDQITSDILKDKISQTHPDLVVLSIPFPGNLYSGLKCGQWIKNNHPNIKIALGGGYANTELRWIKEARVFKYVDFICLDDGEAPLFHLYEHINKLRDLTKLKRTFVLDTDTVKYIDNSTEPDYSIQKTGTPDYTNLPMDRYISVIEIANPMHRLWSDGRWNKLTLAHGCYWGRCTFCDVSLDYIKRFEPQSAKLLCDKIEEMIAQTGQTGFHFVDEAAPPALLKELALEIIRRKLIITWWGNIRFEKNFTRDLCILLKESGCIAISGGLEVASDRLLSIINKGVNISQVARVAEHFTNSGIMVHAYLMYGFPTQTAQETIDSLEIVRQIFMHGIVQSAFWHLFTMTAHSPIGINPKQFNVEKKSDSLGDFANNDLIHIDKQGTNHEQFSEGLRKSLYNYMHGIGFDTPLHEWFDTLKTPRTKVKPNYIQESLENQPIQQLSPRSKVMWLGNNPEIRLFTKNKKGNTYQMAEVSFVSKSNEFSIKLNQEEGTWLCEILPELSCVNIPIKSIDDLNNSFSKACNGDFDVFMTSRAFNQLKENGLLIL